MKQSLLWSAALLLSQAALADHCNSSVKGCIPRQEVNIAPRGYYAGEVVPIFERYMSYALIPLQQVFGDRIAEVRSMDDFNSIQSMWQFEYVGEGPNGTSIYMLCLPRLLGCLQFRPDPRLHTYSGYQSGRFAKSESTGAEDISTIEDILRGSPSEATIDDILSSKATQDQQRYQVYGQGAQ